MNKKYKLTSFQAAVITVIGIAFMIWVALVDFQVIVKF